MIRYEKFKEDRLGVDAISKKSGSLSEIPHSSFPEENQLKMKQAWADFFGGGHKTRRCEMQITKFAIDFTTRKRLFKFTQP